MSDQLPENPSDEDLLALYEREVRAVVALSDDPDEHLLPSTPPGPEVLRQAFNDCRPRFEEEEQHTMDARDRDAFGRTLRSFNDSKHKKGQGWQHKFLHRCGITHGKK
ncbi:hypothetical protein [Cryptosporangium aurantiacum]|uniref:Uncharacterized protein n=1 Tax=Cryptosporangium aurantiacum TaxID=134849 RepID=A0A1M7R298_9ACTN|nr:hypothetical protein [Cryptosporangium aurantiacum]SHN38842.1 hypothetical protein SAMN05443668_106148 [Cryptosporangium aurantiacum]